MEENQVDKDIRAVMRYIRSKASPESQARDPQMCRKAAKKRWDKYYAEKKAQKLISSK